VARPASGAGDPCQPTGVKVLEPASVVAPVVGAANDGERAFLVSRGLSPATVGIYDIEARRVVDNVELPTGDGGWGATVAGGDVYVGTYGATADVHRVEPETRQVTQVTRLEGDTFVWDLATAPDGEVIGGSSPSGRVFAYDPATDTVRHYGAAHEGEMYVRSVAVDDTTIFAGTGTHAHLVAIDRQTGAREDILPPELAGESWVYDLTVTEDYVVAGTEPHGMLAVIDRHDPSSYEVVETGRRTVDQVTVADGAVWFSTRTDGGLHRYDLATGDVTDVAVPSPNEETRLLVVRGGEAFGVSGSGVSWYVDRASGESERIDLQDAGLRAGPEGLQSLAAHDGRVFAGGHWALTVHDTKRGTARRYRLAGEPKAMTTVGSRLYFAEYPGATIATWTARGGYEQLAPLAELQNRPRDVHYDARSKLLLVASMAEYGHLDGALTLYHTRTGKTTGYRGIVDDQTINAVATHKRTAYVATQTSASGIAPTTTEAKIAAFDLKKRRVRWETVPLPGVQSIRHLAYLHGRLYGSAGDRVFAFDPATRRVVRTADVPGAGGEIKAWRGRLFTVTADRILELDQRTLRTTVRADCLGAQWFNEPNLAFDADRGVAYTIAGRSVARARP
jgi:streptogramin lyase